MKKFGARPVAFVLDDDPSFNKLLEGALKRFGVDCETFSASTALVARMRSKLPSLCVLDLNVESVNSTLALLPELRKDFSAEIPLIVSTTGSRSGTITAALEVGATDFIMKPLEREVLVAKLRRYVHSAELDKAAESFIAAPELEFRVTAGVETTILEIDEFGIKLACSSLFPKGAVVPVSGALIAEISDNSQPVLLTVAATEANMTTQTFESYLEFDGTNSGLLTKVRTWLSRKSGGQAA